MEHTLQIESNGRVLEQEALSSICPTKGDCILYDVEGSEEPGVAVVISSVVVGNDRTTYCVAI